MALVYVSPSNQSNEGAGNYGTEKERMEELAASLICWFGGNGVNAKLATLSKSIDDRIKESKTLGATIYLPLHSNGFDGTAQGPLLIYTKDKTQSQNLASEIRNYLFNLYKISFPNATNRALATSATYNYAELRDVSPAISAYIEVAFHDNLADANWIINNKSDIAKAIGTGVKNRL